MVAGSIPLPGEVTDPETSEQLPQPGYPTSAISPDGTVYIAFENSPSASSGSIGLIRSFDGGLTWQRSELPDVNAFAWEPAIAVDQHGTVGVIWYDLRNNRPGDGQTTADVWFASSTDHGDSWHQIRVAGPTDIRTGAAAEQNRFGEYQGLAGLNHGFAAIFGLAAPQAKHSRRPTSSSPKSGQRAATAKTTTRTATTTAETTCGPAATPAIGISFTRRAG